MDFFEPLLLMTSGGMFQIRHPVAGPPPSSTNTCLHIPPFHCFCWIQIPLKTHGVCWFDPQHHCHQKASIAAYAPAVTLFSAGRRRALLENERINAARSNRWCLSYLPPPYIWFRGSLTGVRIVLRMPVRHKRCWEFYKEIQRITESPRKCFLCITTRPCCQGIFEATSRKN